MSWCMGLISLGSEMRSCGVVLGHVLMKVSFHNHFHVSSLIIETEFRDGEPEPQPTCQDSHSSSVWTSTSER